MAGARAAASAIIGPHDDMERGPVIGQERTPGGTAPPARWLAAVVLYFLFNALSQLAVSATADLDQAEQLVFSQDWDLGYSAQPPLYTWLVAGLFSITGPSLTALATVKVGLLSTLVLLLAAIGRRFAFTRRQHLLALAGLAFIPQIVWESQRDLTHSVLATVLAAAILLQTLRTADSRRTADYALLGLVVGLGLLGKYNLIIFIAALMAAVALTRAYRPMLWDARMLLAIAIAAATLLPHLLWVAGHLDIATSSSHKLGTAAASMAQGIGRAQFNALAFLSPLWLFAWFLAGPRPRPANVEAVVPVRFLTALLAMVLLCMALFVGLTGASEIKDRWYLPLLFFAPLLAALLAAPAPRRHAVYVALAALMALAVAVLLPGRTLLGEGFGHVGRPNLPYAAQFAAIAEAIDAPDSVLAENKLVGGNARLVFRKARIVTPDREGRDGGRRLILCEVPGCRERFRAWYAGRYGSDPAALPFRESAMPLYHAEERRHTLYWTVVGG